jgi:type I restriction enzyme S subunit
MKKYPKYKASGIEWIGEIPEHWDISKIKFNDLVIMGQSPNSDECNSENIGLPFLQGNAEFGALHPTPKLWCENSNKKAEPNDILLSVRAPVGAINIANENIGIGRGLCSIRPIKSNTKFIFHYLSFIKDELDSISTGSTFKAINLDDVKNIYIPNIAEAEQTQIANFLDNKTKQIETLIANKQKLIELLQEERTAIINHAVTKGINPKAKLKPSGIDWLGDVPENWEVKKLKFLLKETKDSLKTGPFGSHLKNSDLTSNGEVKVYTQRNVLDNNFDSGEDFINLEKYESLKGFKVEPNDILITTRGTIGRCSEFPKNKQLGILHPCLIRVQVNEKKANPKWIMNYINNTSYFSNNVKYNSNSTIIDVIYGYTLKEIFFPVPPINEQLEVLSYLNNECNRIDTIITKTEQEIELLKEYKTALISEVVTGKVDVSTSSTGL